MFDDWADIARYSRFPSTFLSRCCTFSSNFGRISSRWCETKSVSKSRVRSYAVNRGAIGCFPFASFRRCWNSCPFIGLCHWQWFMSGHEYWQRFRGFVGVSCFRRKMLLFYDHLSVERASTREITWNALLDLLVFLHADKFVSKLFRKACVYFHAINTRKHYSLRYFPSN